MNIIVFALVIAAYALNGLENWMNDTFSIQNKYLHQIAIPGTHHSGFLSVSKWYLKPFGYLAICQTASIASQLDMGIRFFDFRVGEEDGRIKFTHTIASSQYLDDALNDIQSFLGAHPGEVVFLDIRNDGGFKSNTNDQRPQLTNKLTQRFGSMLISGSDYKTKPYRQLINNNKRVVIFGDYEPFPITKRDSWSVTNDPDSQSLVNKIKDWVNNQGLTALRNNEFSLVDGAITPPDGANGASYNLVSIAPSTNQLLATMLDEISVPINLIAHDLANLDLINKIIAYNAK